MNFFEKLVDFMMPTMTTPTTFGAFHFVSLLIVILTTVYLSVWQRDMSDKCFRRVVLSVWIVMVVLEIYKQIVFAFELNGGDPIWDYAWYAFPFQFCSTPLYVLPFVALCPDGKFRDGCISFMCYFSLLAGIAVMIYPGDVYIRLVGINLQTMMHHGTQVVFGIWFLVRERRSISFRHLMRAVPVYLSLVLTALILNIAVYKAFMARGIEDTFNMFFISPYFDCTLPILSDIYKVVPYPVFLVLYILAFTLGTSLICLTALGIKRLARFWGNRDGEVENA